MAGPSPQPLGSERAGEIATSPGLFLPRLAHHFLQSTLASRSELDALFLPRKFPNSGTAQPQSICISTSCRIPGRGRRGWSTPQTRARPGAPPHCPGATRDACGPTPGNSPGYGNVQTTAVPQRFKPIVLTPEVPEAKPKSTGVRPLGRGEGSGRGLGAPRPETRPGGGPRDPAPALVSQFAARRASALRAQWGGCQPHALRRGSSFPESLVQDAGEGPGDGGGGRENALPSLRPRAPARGRMGWGRTQDFGPANPTPTLSREPGHSCCLHSQGPGAH